VSGTHLLLIEWALVAQMLNQSHVGHHEAGYDGQHLIFSSRIGLFELETTQTDFWHLFRRQNIMPGVTGLHVGWKQFRALREHRIHIVTVGLVVVNHMIVDFPVEWQDHSFGRFCNQLFGLATISLRHFDRLFNEFSVIIASFHSKPQNPLESGKRLVDTVLSVDHTGFRLHVSCFLALSELISALGNNGCGKRGYRVMYVHGRMFRRNVNSQRFIVTDGEFILATFDIKGISDQQMISFNAYLKQMKLEARSIEYHRFMMWHRRDNEVA